MYAYAYDVREDLKLLIDPITKARRLRNKANDKARWDELAATAVQHEIKLRCTKDGVATLLDNKTKIIGLGGSARAGKSQLALSWIARQWMIRGGPGALFWLIGPTVSDAHNLMKKLIFGDGEENNRWSPAVLPTEGETNAPSLAFKWPEGQRTTDQTIYMVDGSQFALKHADAKKIKGVTCQAAVFTEAAEVKNDEVYQQLIGRTVSSGGQVVIESTFKETNHWTMTQLRRKAYDEEVVYEKNPKHKTVTTWQSLFATDNPWLSKEAIEIWKQSLTSDVMMKREFLGIAADGDNHLWSDVWNDDIKPTVLFDSETYDPGDIGENDITKQACYAFGFKRPHDFIAGQDINVYPMSTLICKVVGNLEDRESWKLIIYYVYDNNGITAYEHAKKLKYFRGGMFANTGIVMDPANCMKNPHKAHTGGRNTTSIAALFAQQGFEVIPAKGTIFKPSYINVVDSVSATKRMFNAGRIRMERTKTDALQHALENQISHDGYRAYKPAGSSHDRMSSVPDCLRYIIWRGFAKELLPTNNDIWIR